VLGDDHRNTLISMGNLASTHRALGDLDDARKLDEQTLAARRRVLGEHHPDTVVSMNNLATTRHRSMHNLARTRWALGDLRDARDLFEQALAGRQRVLGDDHPATLDSMDSLAAVRRELGEL
jgi:Tetratricopeptide repeat